MDTINQNFLNRFKELFELYKTVKSYILLSEEVTGKLVAASVNELRAVLDHLFKSFYFTNEVLDVDKQEAEIYKAFRHLKRAGYDALEVIALYKLPEIKSILNNYSVDTITTGYSDYYTKDRKALSKIEKQLAKDRDGIDGATFFDDFEILITKLLEIDDRISDVVPTLNEIKQKIKKNSNRKVIKNVIVGVVIGLSVSVVSWLLFEYLF